jgi:acetyl-CoA carboxylase carboxyltransferase component
MGGARMHTTVSGVGDNLVPDDAAAIDLARLYLSFLPTNFRQPPPWEDWSPPEVPLVDGVVPLDDKAGYDVHKVIDGLLDAGSFFEIKPAFAAEMVVGLGRLEGHPVGIVANNPMIKGGVLFTDTADKATRFINLCNAFNVPLLFLADVPGFMIGTQVEREGIIRHGAKMISAVSEATVPKICIVLRKCYGAGLYAMCGPAFEPEATIALPTAQIAIMGPEPAVNAVFYNKIQAIADPDERAAFVAEQRRIYETDVDLLRLASDLVIDAIVEPEHLREDLIRRIGLAQNKSRHFTDRHNGVTPV